MKKYIGFNVNTRYGFETSADHAHRRGATAFQIFLQAPRMMRSKPKGEEQLAELGRRIAKYGQRCVVHGSYMMNFCRDPKHQIHKMAIKLLCDDLAGALAIGAVGVIIHMGKAVGLDAETAFDNYVAGLKSVLEKSDPKSTIILETGAGCGTEVGTSLSQLGQIRARLPKQYRSRIKYCLDTCHMFAAGYHLGDPEFVDVIIEEVNIHLGWPNVVCIHLNDSYDPLHSRRDHHADLGKGTIALEGLGKFIRYAINQDIMIVLETPTNWYDDETDEMVMKYSGPKKVPKNASRLDFPKQMRIVESWLK